MMDYSSGSNDEEDEVTFNPRTSRSNTGGQPRRVSNSQRNARSGTNRLPMHCFFLTYLVFSALTNGSRQTRSSRSNASTSTTSNGRARSLLTVSDDDETAEEEDDDDVQEDEDEDVVDDEEDVEEEEEEEDDDMGEEEEDEDEEDDEESRVDFGGQASFNSPDR